MNNASADKWGGIARAALFALLWFVGSFYLLGDLGKWVDDWAFHSRDLATDSFRWADVFALDHFNTRFWRPLHIRVSAGLQTVFWHHDWVNHSIVAMVHAINAWLLWKVLGRMCASKHAPAAAALLFLVYPASHEAIFWLSTFGTTAGMTWFLLCTLAAQRFAAGEIGWGKLLWHTPLLLTMGWWYEQPAACGPAIALAFLACARSGSTRRRVGIAAGLVCAALVAGMVYAVILMVTANPAARGSMQRVVGRHELGPHLMLILSQAWRLMTLRGFVGGAMEEGWRAIRSRPVEAVLVGLWLMGAAVGFGWWWMRGRATMRDAPGTVPGAVPNRSAFERACTIGFGACIVAASLVPAIAVQGQWFASRLAYFPGMGMAIVLAGGLDAAWSSAWFGSHGWAGRVGRGLGLAGLLFAVVCGSIMLVGVQSVRHKRSLLDRQFARELRILAPNPPEDALLVPIGLGPWPTRTREGRFECIGTGPFDLSWSAAQFARFVYHRSDLFGLGANRWAVPARRLDGCEGAGGDGLVLGPGVFTDGRYPIDSAGRRTVPWDRIVAFRINDKGHVRILDVLRLEDPEFPEFDRLVPLTAAGRRRDAGFKMGVASLPRVPQRVVDRPAWALSGSDGVSPKEQAGAAPRLSLGRTEKVFTMHPRVATIKDRMKLSARIEPSSDPRTLAMRVGMLEQALGASDGVGVSVWLEGDPAPLVNETITPERLRGQGWVLLHVIIPPTALARTVRVEVDAGPAKDPNADWCIVTPPVLSN